MKKNHVECEMCGHRINIVTDTGDIASEGDVVICPTCASVFLIDEHDHIKFITKDELDELARHDPRAFYHVVLVVNRLKNHKIQRIWLN